jgi:hypothetical protein
MSINREHAVSAVTAVQAKRHRGNGIFRERPLGAVVSRHGGNMGDLAPSDVDLGVIASEDA